MTARTDATGTAVFKSLPQSSRVCFTIDAVPNVHRPLVLAGSIAVPPVPTAPITIRLPLDGVITGQVRHARTGKPLAGSSVSLEEPGDQGGGRPRGPKTDEQGRFRFIGLYPATYRLRFDDVGERVEGNQYCQSEPGLVTLTAPGGPGESKEFTAHHDLLVLKTGSVEVTVRDATGRPVFAQKVTLNFARSGGGGWTDLDGKITLNGLPGNYNVTWTRSRDGKGKEAVVRMPVTLTEGASQTVTVGASAEGNHAPLRALAPDFAGLSLLGETVRLSQFHGKVVVLDLVSLSGGDSGREALRHAEAAARQVDTARVVFVAVCRGSEQDKDDTGWLARNADRYKAEFPHLLLLQEAPGLPKEVSVTERYQFYGGTRRFLIGPDRTLRNAYGYGTHDSDPNGLLRDIGAVLGAERFIRSGP